MVTDRSQGRGMTVFLPLVMALTWLVAGCGGGQPKATTAVASGRASGATPTAPTAPEPSSPESPRPRPASDATIRITSPRSGKTVAGPTVHVAIRLTGAHIVQTTTTDIRPDEGHIHLYVDNSLVSMNYELEQDLDLAPGTWYLRAEFVAADHAPFSPRVVSQDVVVIVR